jgi:hypothetical protein
MLDHMRTNLNVCLGSKKCSTRDRPHHCLCNRLQDRPGRRNQSTVRPPYPPRATRAARRIRVTRTQLERAMSLQAARISPGFLQAARAHMQSPRCIWGLDFHVNYTTRRRGVWLNLKLIASSLIKLLSFSKLLLSACLNICLHVRGGASNRAGTRMTWLKFQS